MTGHVSPKSLYYAIFAALMVFTAITVGIAYVNLGPFNLPVALSIAIVKATLVVLFFMHVKYSSQLTKVVIATGLFFLAILFALTLTDYLSRGWRTDPSAAPAGSTVPAGQSPAGPHAFS